jgi:hypothetical protein
MKKRLKLLYLHPLNPQTRKLVAHDLQAARRERLATPRPGLPSHGTVRLGGRAFEFLPQSLRGRKEEMVQRHLYQASRVM